MTRRQMAAALTAGCLAAAALALVVSGPGGRAGSNDGTAAGGSRTPPATGRPSTVLPSSSATNTGTVGYPTSPDPASRATGTPLASSGGTGPFLAVGSLSDSRVMVSALADVTGARGDERTYRMRLASPVVGAPWTMTALPGRQLALSATNQAQLVLLTDGLTKTRTLDMRSALGFPEEGMLSYGTLAVRNGTVYGAVARGNDVVAFAVDVASWSLRASRPLNDTAQFPHACVTDDGTLAVLTTERLTLLSTPALGTLASVRLDGSPLGLACAGREAVVADDLEPRVRRFDASGKSTGTLTYDGTGAAQTTHADGVLFLSDEVRRTVVRCVLASAACTVSKPFEGRPYSLLRAGNALLMGMQVAKQIVVMDPTTLDVRGTIPFPGMPRAFAVIE